MFLSFIDDYDFSTITFMFPSLDVNLIIDGLFLINNSYFLLLIFPNALAATEVAMMTAATSAALALVLSP